MTPQLSNPISKVLSKDLQIQIGFRPHHDIQIERVISSLGSFYIPMGNDDGALWHLFRW